MSTVESKKLQEVALRIREMREIADLTQAEMAQKTEVTEEEYIRYENGEVDFPFSFLHKCAKVFGSISPKRKITTVVRIVASETHSSPNEFATITVASVAQPIFTILFPIRSTDKASSKLSRTQSTRFAPLLSFEALLII
jgi:DNA-binding XRE family transcriptional regulator